MKHFSVSPCASMYHLENIWKVHPQTLNITLDREETMESFVEKTCHTKVEVKEADSRASMGP
jgi:hypothetical protein